MKKLNQKNIIELIAVTFTTFLLCSNFLQMHFSSDTYALMDLGYFRYPSEYFLHDGRIFSTIACLTEIANFLKGEKLQLNRKTRIYKCTNNFIFLGRNKRCKYAKYRDVNRKLKKQKYLYHSGKIQLNSLINSMICYEHLDNI